MSRGGIHNAMFAATTLRVDNTEKERIPMFWGFGHGLLFLLPLLFLGKIFWLVILALLIVGLIRWFSLRRRQMPAYPFGMPPMQQPSALEILRQRYARGEIDAATYDQMRERLEATMPGQQQHS
jgi:putative membrane protein